MTSKFGNQYSAICNMKILCEQNMPFAREAFSALGEVIVKPGRAITAADVRDVEIMAVRSTTKINRALLAGSKVRFVGTATIGTDHMEIPWIEQNGIHWCYAPGCNANSVAEYIVAALLHLGRKHGFRLEGRTIGVVGVGNVGSRVAVKARALGMRVLLNDPPRARGDGRGDETFVELAQVLADSDIVTMHVPLTREGPDATWHMLGRDAFAHMRSGAILLNAARGPVLATDDLLAAMAQGRVARAVLDTWEGEPEFRADAMAKVDLGTPHIAGHSFEGKVAGTLMVYREACRFLGVEATWTPDAIMPAPLVPAVTIEANRRADEDVLAELVARIYDITADDARLRAFALQDGKARAAGFDELRRTYPERREFPATVVTLKGASAELQGKVRGLGFKIR